MAELEIDTNTADPGTQETSQEINWEEKAGSQGWRPREEFEGEAEDFVDAKEFVQRKPLFEKIESQSKQLKELNKAFSALKGHYTKVHEASYKEALARVENARAQAVAEGDGQKFNQLDRQVEKIKADAAALKEVDQAPAQQDPSEFAAWKGKNTWYEKDEDLRDYADFYGTKLARQGMAPDDVLKEVTKKVRAEFPHKFTNQNKAAAPDIGVSSGRGGSSSRQDPDVSGMSDEERSIMNTLIKSGISKEQYLKDYKLVKNRR